MTLTILVLGVFFAATGSIIGLYVLIAGRGDAAMRRSVDTRLRDVTSGTAAADDEEAVDIVRTESGGAFDRAVKLALRGASFERWIEQSGVGITVGGLLTVALLLGLTAGVVAAMVSRLMWVGAIAFAIGAALPFAYVKRRRTVRINTFEELFPEALDLMSRAVRAGHAFSAGLKMVADEMRQPVGPEFRKAFDEQNYGLPLKESLHNLAGRMPLLDVRFFATAVLIQRETGGNLAEILDNLAKVVRERFKIRRQVRVHTAHGRMTGYVLMALPAFLAVAMTFLNPEHMNPLFRDPIGQMIITVGIVMQIIGWFWMKQVVKIEV